MKALSENNWSLVLYDSSFSVSPSPWAGPEEPKWASLFLPFTAVSRRLVDTHTPKHTPNVHTIVLSDTYTCIHTKCARTHTPACTVPQHTHASVNDDQMWGSGVLSFVVFVVLDLTLWLGHPHNCLSLYFSFLVTLYAQNKGNHSLIQDMSNWWSRKRNDTDKSLFGMMSWHQVQAGVRYGFFESEPTW